MSTTTNLDTIRLQVRVARTALDDLMRAVRYLDGEDLAIAETNADTAAAALATASSAITTAVAAI